MGSAPTLDPPAHKDPGRRQERHPGLTIRSPLSPSDSFYPFRPRCRFSTFRGFGGFCTFCDRCGSVVVGTFVGAAGATGVTGGAPSRLVAPERSWPVLLSIWSPFACRAPAQAN